MGDVRRVVIVGASGAGKSVLARRLGARTGLPVVHLDPMFWRDGWAPVPRAEALAALASATCAERWIIEGDFLEAGLADTRFVRAQTVIFLDLPRRTCLRRVLMRRLRGRGHERPDLPPGCEESLDLGLLRWIWSYPKAERLSVLAILEGLRRRGVTVHHLRSPSDVREFLAIH